MQSYIQHSLSRLEEHRKDLCSDANSDRRWEMKSWAPFCLCFALVCTFLNFLQLSTVFGAGGRQGGRRVSRTIRTCLLQVGSLAAPSKFTRPLASPPQPCCTVSVCSHVLCCHCIRHACKSHQQRRPPVGGFQTLCALQLLEGTFHNA